MKMLRKSLSFLAIVAVTMICGVNANAQGMGGHGLHDGYHGMDWPDTLTTLTVSGTVRVDSLPHLGFMHNLDVRSMVVSTPERSATPDEWCSGDN
jgi:hypothetical protein